MSDDAFDIDDTPPLVLKDLMVLAERTVEQEKMVKDLEDQLKMANSILNELKTKTLPDAMAEAGLADGEIKMADGTSIKVEEFVSGSLPKDPARRAFALSVLTEAGGESLIKNELSMEFEKREHNRALELADKLRSEGYEVNVDSSVHPQTLAAFVREKLRNGDEINYEGLGCFVGRKAKIKLGKK